MHYAVPAAADAAAAAAVFLLRCDCGDRVSIIVSMIEF